MPYEHVSNGHYFSFLSRVFSWDKPKALHIHPYFEVGKWECLFLTIL